MVSDPSIRGNIGPKNEVRIFCMPILTPILTTHLYKMNAIIEWDDHNDYLQLKEFDRV